MEERIREIESLNRELWKYRRKDTEKAIELSAKIDDLLKLHPNRRERIKQKAALADWHSKQGNYEESFSLIEEIFPELDHPDLLWIKPWIFASSGGSRWHLGQIDEALVDFTRQYELSREIGDWSCEAKALNNLGLVYGEMGNNQKTLEVLDKSLLLYEKKNDNHGQVLTLNNIAMTMIDERKPAVARKYAEKALTMADTNDVGTPLKAALLDTIGLIHMHLGEYEKSFDYHHRCLVLAQKYNIMHSEAMAFFHLGELYFRQGETEEALIWLNDSVKLIEKSRLFSELVNCHRILSDLYREKGLSDQADYHLAEMEKLTGHR